MVNNRFKKSQKDLIADKLMDLANLAASALIFSQLISSSNVKLKAFFVGLGCLIFFYVSSIILIDD